MKIFHGLNMCDKKNGNNLLITSGSKRIISAYNKLKQTNKDARNSLDFLKIDVDYNETAVVIPTYDNTLNNITMNLGTTVISGGTIVLD